MLQNSAATRARGLLGHGSFSRICASLHVRHQSILHVGASKGRDTRRRVQTPRNPGSRGASVADLQSFWQGQLSSLTLYNPLQPECELVFTRVCTVFIFRHLLRERISSRRLSSRFRCGCHGLHVDTGRLGSQKLPREDRVCHACQSSSVEDEHHFLFDCPVYAHTRDTFATLFQGCSHTVAFFIYNNNRTVVGRYLRIRTCFSHRQFVLEHDSISV